MPTAESNGVRLHYELSGNPHGPVLVLINSLGSSMLMWQKVLPALEKDNRILRFDMRGHGKSQVVSEPFSIEDLSRDVLGLLDEVRVERANICGLSLGGMVALWLGIHAPERVNRAIFANTAARIGNRILWQRRVKAVRSEGMSSLATATIGRWFTSAFRSQHLDETETVRTMIAATDPAGYAACCAVLRDADLTNKAGKVVASSLVIAGAHDPATPPKEGRALNALLRNSRYIELNASHLSAWESADEFAEAVVQHLTAGEKTDG